MSPAVLPKVLLRPTVDPDNVVPQRSFEELPPPLDELPPPPPWLGHCTHELGKPLFEH